ncbi:MAG: transposase [Micromonosporaceae bacterium]
MQLKVKARPSDATAAARVWLTVCQLPPYAHELNPVEPVWSHLKRSLANLAKRNLSQLTALVRTPPQTDAVPARPPRQHQARPHALQ